LAGEFAATEMRALTQANLEFLILPILNGAQRHRLKRGEEVALVHAVEGGDAYQVSVSNNDGLLALSGFRLFAK
jgi:hypothetical protein